MTKQRYYLTELDQTQNYDSSWLKEYNIQQVKDQYIYTPEIHTYLCELTPSVCLYYIRTMVVLKDGIEYTEKISELEDEMISGAEDIIYIHALDMYNVKKKFVGWHEYNPTDDEPDKIEDLVDTYRCNVLSFIGENK